MKSPRRGLSGLRNKDPPSNSLTNPGTTHQDMDCLSYHLLLSCSAPLSFTPLTFHDHPLSFRLSLPRFLYVFSALSLSPVAQEIVLPSVLSACSGQSFSLRHFARITWFWSVCPKQLFCISLSSSVLLESRSIWIRPVCACRLDYYQASHDRSFKFQFLESSYHYLLLLLRNRLTLKKWSLFQDLI